MRGEHMFKILSALEEIEEIALDSLGALLLERGSEAPIQKQQAPVQEKRQAKRRFYAMVSYLEQDGLVIRQMTRTQTVISITAKGKKKLDVLEESVARILPSIKEEESERRVGEGSVLLVTFEVPEKERAKRDWIRTALRDLGFSMIHKSVWTGSDGIPLLFLEHVETLGLKECVGVFQIGKNGQLKKIF